MLTEQTSSRQNWQSVNMLARPGVLRLWSFLAVAHGANRVMYFQLLGGAAVEGTLDLVGYDVCFPEMRG